MKFKVEIDTRKNSRIQSLQRVIKNIDEKIERLEKIKKNSLHTKGLRVKKAKLLIILAKERMFGD